MKKSLLFLSFLMAELAIAQVNNQSAEKPYIEVTGTAYTSVLLFVSVMLERKNKPLTCGKKN